MGISIPTWRKALEERWRDLALGREERDAGEAERNKLWVRGLRLGAVRSCVSRFS